MVTDSGGFEAWKSALIHHIFVILLHKLVTMSEESNKTMTGKLGSWWKLAWKKDDNQAEEKRDPPAHVDFVDMTQQESDDMA